MTLRTIDHIDIQNKGNDAELFASRIYVNGSLNASFVQSSMTLWIVKNQDLLVGNNDVRFILGNVCWAEKNVVRVLLLKEFFRPRIQTLFQPVRVGSWMAVSGNWTICRVQCKVPTYLLAFLKQSKNLERALKCDSCEAARCHPNGVMNDWVWSERHLHCAREYWSGGHPLEKRTMHINMAIG